MAPRVLHVLSQRPGRTGSGVTLEAWVREAARAGWTQDVVVGVPADDAALALDALEPDRLHPLRFESPALPFPLPGMSDVMPYPSSVWSALTPEQLARYEAAWRAHLAAVVEVARPDVIHAHHLWLLSSLLKVVAPSTPLVLQSHATGLRQMALCPHLAPRVVAGCRRAERVLALSSVHAAEIRRVLDLPGARVRVVGAGYREDLFREAGEGERRSEDLLYVGKYSRAKGLPWLLDAFDRLRERRPGVRLHLVGDVAGTEGRGLEARAASIGDAVLRHGHLPQPALAALMREVGVLVLPSFYEGLPLVLVEGVASGCRAVATRLPVIENDLAPRLGGALALVEPPGLTGIDEPRPEDLPAFVDRLARALERAVAAPVPPRPAGLDAFTWREAFARVEGVWREALRDAEVAGEAGDR